MNKGPDFIFWSDIKIDGYTGQPSKLELGYNSILDSFFYGLYNALRERSFSFKGRIKFIYLIFLCFLYGKRI